MVNILKLILSHKFKCLGHRHPMKPHRLTLTNSLVMNYGLFKKMKVKFLNVKFFKIFLLNLNLRCISRHQQHPKTCAVFIRLTILTFCKE